MDIIPDGPTLVLAGHLDVRSTGEVREAIYDHLEEHTGDITIDVTAVEAVDLIALRVVAVASCRATRSGQQIVLRGASAPLLRMLHLTRLIRVVELEREPIGA